MGHGQAFFMTVSPIIHQGDSNGLPFRIEGEKEGLLEEFDHETPLDSNWARQASIRSAIRASAPCLVGM